MKISLSGQLLKPSINKPVCRKAMNFYAALLMTKRMCDSIEVKLKFVDKDEESTLDPGEMGSCSCFDDEERPKIFDIEILNDMGYRNTLKAIAHEMVHVEQSATGKLRFYENSTKPARFMKSKIDCYKVEYWDYEWEIEAFGREHGLYRRFQKYLKGNYTPKRARRR